ncbi:BolA family transcriptional regulator [Mariprofundus erugo]|uniref:BolA family protein n=1 Tax=Mariprofundus erugo TaxID=2528639 RepID=UPI0010FE6911|nr:BolA family protein [Mariprofundus erugo]TLS75261.1 BolA family transcriptional regulator [Mariprofundus erugo]
MSINTSQHIHALLTEAFAPAALSIEDDSAGHAGHAGAREHGGGHFTVHICAAIFAGKSRIQSHRLIHQALAPLFPHAIHALCIEVLPYTQQ